MSLKTLGTLSPEQLQRILTLVDGLPTLSDVSELMKQPKLRRALQGSGTTFQWAWAYELSFPELLGLLIWAMGAQEVLASFIASDDPQEAAIRSAEMNSEPNVPNDFPAWRLLLVMELLVACIKCIESYRTYSVTICDLVAIARNGKTKALADAVRLDPTVLATPCIAEAVSLATLDSNEDLLKQVKKAYATPKAKLAVYDKLRLAGVFLNQAGALTRENYDHIYDVIVKRMRLYDERGEEPRRALLRSLKLWQNAST